MVERHPPPHRFSLVPVYLAFIIDSFGLAIIYPILTPLFLRPEFAFLSSSLSTFQKTALLGLAIAMFPLAQLLGAPIIGECSDRIGRKKAFIISISGAALGYTTTAFGIMVLQLPILLLGRAISGFFAGNLTICLASIADFTPDPNERTKCFGRLAAFSGVSFIVGIIVGSVLSSPTHEGLHPSIPFWVIAFFSLLNLVLILLFFHPAPIKGASRPFSILRGIKNIFLAFREVHLRNLYFVFFFFMICWISSMQFLSTYLIRKFNATATLIQIALIISGAIWSLTNAFLAKKISRSHKITAPLPFSLLALTCILPLTLLTHKPWLFMALFALSTFCSALSWTLIQSSVSLRAGPDTQGRSLGINQSVGALAGIVGPLLGGVIAGASAAYVYLFASLAALCAFIIIINDTETSKSDSRNP